MREVIQSCQSTGSLSLPSVFLLHSFYLNISCSTVQGHIILRDVLRFLSFCKALRLFTFITCACNTGTSSDFLRSCSKGLNHHLLIEDLHSLYGITCHDKFCVTTKFIYFDKFRQKDCCRRRLRLQRHFLG